MRRSGLLALLVALAGASAPASAAADSTTITMPGKFFDPARATLVAGDAVVFRNHDFVTHDVRISGGLFDSGPILRFTSWSQQIGQPGGYPFLCTLHPFMSGNLDVVAATLTAAPDGVLAGEPLILSGRAPAGSASLGVERSVSGGEWSAIGGGVTPAPDGSFQTTVPAVEGASYRVTTALGAGQVVTPRVTAGVDVRLAVRRTHRDRTLRIDTMPAAAGFTATLELYSRWHYRWRAKRHSRLDAHGRATFRLPLRARAYARVLLRRRPGGPALVRSGVVKLWSGKPARDPDTIAPSTPDAHGGAGYDDGGEQTGAGGHGAHG